MQINHPHRIRKISRIMLLATLPLFHSTDVFGQWLLKATYDMQGQHAMTTTHGFGDRTLEDSKDVVGGITLATEFTVGHTFQIGAGIEHLLRRELDNIEGAFSFTSFYFTTKYKFPARLSPFVSAKLGWSISFSGDETYKDPRYSGLDGIVQGGFPGEDRQLRTRHIFGIGAGLFLNEHFFFETTYNFSRGERRHDSSNRIMDVDYTRISLGIGYVF